MKLISWFIFVIMLSFGVRLLAQEATEEAPQGWPVVERCVGEPIVPPADWSFEGTILATGWAGIHGINAEWDTPYVVSFFRNRSIMPFSISPNGDWIAQVEGSIYADEVYWASRIVTIDKLTIRSTINPQETYTSDYIANRFVAGLSDSLASLMRPFWWDESSVILASNNQNGSLEFIAWSFLNNEIYTIDSDYHSYIDINNAYSYLSPDKSMFLDLNSIRGGSGLIDLETGEIIQTFDSADITPLGSAQWLADSSAFIVETFRFEGDYTLIGFRLYNRDGELLDTISIERRLASYHPQFELSPNDELFAYQFYVSEEDALYRDFQIANLSNHEIIATCIESASFAWSPSSRQIAIMPRGNGQRPVLVLDLDDWQLYNTGIYHDGDIIFWRAD